MTSLLDTLNTEIGVLDGTGASGLDTLLGETGSVLSDLIKLETELEYEILTEKENDDGNTDTVSENSREFSADFVSALENKTSQWYKRSIDSLKSYNGQISRFSRNVVNNTAFNFDLDDAYTYPLMLDTHPAAKTTENGVLGISGGLYSTQGAMSVPQSTHSRYSADNVDTRAKNSEILMTSAEINVAKSDNRHQLMRSIVLHFLKTGHGALMADMLSNFGVSGEIDPETLAKFLQLGTIADDIRQRHDMKGALDWLSLQLSNGDTSHELTSLKFHVLQFSLLLSRNIKQNDRALELPGHVSSLNLPDAHEAGVYAKKHFSAFFKNYADDVMPFMNFLLIRTGREMRAYREKVLKQYLRNREEKQQTSKYTTFVAEVLLNLEHVDEMDGFFDQLATEFVHEFCKSMSLSAESSLFQAVLAGHVNLPSFSKYSHLQQKLGRRSVSDLPDVADSQVDLPFPLSSRNQLYFKFHPIFVCPISKEQSMPLVSIKRVGDAEARERKRKSIFISPNEMLVSPPNPVVMFEFCRHLALKESVRNLIKTGGDSFKCHYCYKKHRIGNISDAYLIDL